MSSNNIPKKIAIFGGSFDPFHNGHAMMLQMLHDAVYCPRFDEIYVAPCLNNPNKTNSQADIFHRRALIRAAITNMNFTTNQPKILAQDYEFMIDLLINWHRIKANDDLYLVLGSDSVKEFHRWKSYHEIPNYTNLIMFVRDVLTTSADKDDINHVQGMFEGAGKSFIRIGGPSTTPSWMIPSFSSTSIRAMVQSGIDIRNLVPSGVNTIIKNSGLYRTNEVPQT